LLLELEEYFEASKELINKRIEKWLKELNVDDPMIQNTFEGGKRLRSILTMLVSDSLNIERDQALDLATAIEFVHNATLIHDDIIDLHTIRRGKDSLWRNVGAKSAVLIGDLLFTFAGYKLSNISPEALDVITKAMYRVTRGVYLEDNPSAGSNYGYKLYIVINRYKTAELFAAASKLGSLLCGNKKIIDAMYKYGLAIGEAYQLADDLVGLIAATNVPDSPIDYKPLRLLLVFLKRNDFINYTTIASVEDREILRELNELGADRILRSMIDERIREAEKLVSYLPHNEYSEYLFKVPSIMINAMLNESFQFFKI